MSYIFFHHLAKNFLDIICHLVAVIHFSLKINSLRFLMLALSSYVLGKYCKKSFIVLIQFFANIDIYLGVVLSVDFKSDMRKSFKGFKVPKASKLK
jgi:hypothetical protein